MPFRSMEQGIKAIQSGNLTEGARLLRIALKAENPALTGKLRAVALMWLAETTTDRDQKMAYYQEALTADPGSPDVQQRMALLLAPQMPPEPTRADSAPFTPVPSPPPGSTPVPGQTPSYPVPVQGQTPTAPMPAQPYPAQPQPPTFSPQYAAPTPGASGAFYRTVGIMDGPNGPGTAFFVAQNGLLATTRYVVGGATHVTVMLEAGRYLPGRVVRAYSDIDVALISVELAVSKLLPVSPSPTIPNNMPLTAISHSGRVMSGSHAASKRSMAAHWFPTTITAFADAGGNPIFDDRNYLVGMLTRNVSRTSGYVFGLHISAVFRAVENYVQETRLDPNRVYCPSCGSPSRAANFQAFYCEVCGSVLPFAQETPRFPTPQAETFYGENMHTPCRHCGSRLGYYNGRCLRCGNEANAPTKLNKGR